MATYTEEKYGKLSTDPNALEPGADKDPFNKKQDLISQEAYDREIAQRRSEEKAQGQMYDPEMMGMRSRLEDLSKGYSGKELGALKSQAESEMAGHRSNYLRQLSSKAARGGIGGARAAAMQGAADVGMQGQAADMQRKMTLDNANMIRQGNKDYTDFVLRQKYGVMGAGIAGAKMQLAEQGYKAAAKAANKDSGGGFLSGLLGDIF